MNSKEQVKIIKERSGTDASKCMKCGKCSGRCPAYNEMDIKPHQFVSMIEKGEVEKLLKCKAIYNCLSCFACVRATSFFYNFYLFFAIHISCLLLMQLLKVQ